MAGKGGGAWKVAYADFVTAMMAFFMVMWLVSQNGETKEAVEEYFQNPTVQLLPAWVSRGPNELGGSSKKYQGEEAGPDEGKGSKKNKLQRRVREDVRHARLLMRTDGDQTVTGSIITFAEQSAALAEQAKSDLDQLIPQLAGKSNRIELRGHTSRRPPVEGEHAVDDWQLSFARSVAVMRYLEDAGIEAQRMRLSQAGAYEPPNEKDGEGVDQARVEVYVLSEFVDAHPQDGHAHSPATDHGQSHLDDEGHAEDHGSDPHAPAHGASGDAAHGITPPKKKTPAKPAHGKDAHGKPAHGKPAGGHGKPADGHGKPAGGHGKPAGGHGKPAGGHGKPAGGHGKPAAKPSGHGAKKPAKSGHGGGH